MIDGASGQDMDKIVNETLALPNSVVEKVSQLTQ